MRTGSMFLIEVNIRHPQYTINPGGIHSRQAHHQSTITDPS